MDNIYKIICDTLIPLGYPIKEQGSYPVSTTLPETFITYFIIDSPNGSFADNTPTSKTTRIQLVLYSKKPYIKQSADDLFKSVMLLGGFLRVGGRDLPFNADTGHYAYTCDYRYYEMEE